MRSMDDKQRRSGRADDEPVGAVELVLGAEAAVASIRLPAREAGVAVVRQFVAGMASVLHLDEHACEDLKLAATERTSAAPKAPAAAPAEATQEPPAEEKPKRRSKAREKQAEEVTA